MEYDDVPEFEKRQAFKVLPLMTSVFSEGGANSFVRLLTFPDGHFRAIFRRSYFVMQGAATEPTKSQWNTLKKRLKRRDHRIFIFKEHGTVRCDDASNSDADCLYLDFGFFKYA